MITKKQYDDAKKLIEEYEKQPKDDFIPGEFVQGSDNYSGKRFDTVFVYKGIDDNNEYSCCNIGSKAAFSLSFLRRPVDVPGIWIRWTGGECPVSNKDAKVIVKCRDGELSSDMAGLYGWRHSDSVGDIIAYMIVPEWMK